MGVEKINRPSLSPGEAFYPVQALSSTQTATALTNRGVSYISSTSTAGTNFFGLPLPPRAGAVKKIVVRVGTTDAVDIFHASTLSLFAGTTFNGIRFSTGAQRTRSVELIARTSTQWLVGARSTGVTLIGSTEVAP